MVARTVRDGEVVSSNLASPNLLNLIIYSLTIDKTFKISIFLKGINGLLEIIGGILLFIFNPSKIAYIVLLLTQNEISEDPHDIIANYLINLSQNFSINTQIFSVIYLITHGIIKIFLVISLWEKKLWAYPLAISIFIVFIFYQIYRFSYNYSIGLLFLTILDIIIIILTWLEYKNLLKIKK